MVPRVVFTPPLLRVTTHGMGAEQRGAAGGRRTNERWEEVVWWWVGAAVARPPRNLPNQPHQGHPTSLHQCVIGTDWRAAELSKAHSSAWCGGGVFRGTLTFFCATGEHPGTS